MCTRRGGLSDMSAGGNPTATTAATPGTPGRTIAVDNTTAGVNARMRLLLGYDLDAATPAQRADAHDVAIAWGRAASAMKNAGFTDEGHGVWSFDTDAHTSTSINTQIGAQILDESSPRFGGRAYSMVSWTGADSGARRYFTTLAAAKKAARTEMQIRLSRWARAQQLG